MSDSKEDNSKVSGEGFNAVTGGVLKKQVSIQGREANEKLNSGGTITVTISVGGNVKNPAINK